MTKILSKEEFIKTFAESDTDYDNRLRPKQWFRDTVRALQDTLNKSKEVERIILDIMKDKTHDAYDESTLKGILKMIFISADDRSMRNDEVIEEAYTTYDNNFKLKNVSDYVAVKNLNSGELKTLINENDILQYRAPLQRKFFNTKELPEIEITEVKDGKEVSKKTYGLDSWKELFSDLKKYENEFMNKNEA